MVRVISGAAKGHRLKTVKGLSVRPTSDRVKEALFSIIASYVPGACVLDLFAGTGNLGIEALSRGASFAVFVDKNPACVDTIKENLARTGFADKAQVLAFEASKALKTLSSLNQRFSVILLDPPYNKNFVEKTLKIIDENDIISCDGIIIAERDIDDNVGEKVGRLKLMRNEKYGNTVLSFYMPE